MTQLDYSFERQIQLEREDVRQEDRELSIITAISLLKKYCENEQAIYNELIQEEYYKDLQTVKISAQLSDIHIEKDSHC